MCDVVDVFEIVKKVPFESAVILTKMLSIINIVDVKRLILSIISFNMILLA